jgi:hypothetical protein
MSRPERRSAVTARPLYSLVQVTTALVARVRHHTAVCESPVSSPWITHALGISPQAVREDRILHEALAAGGGIRRLCDLFGLTVGGAERYARPAETDN